MMSDRRSTVMQAGEAILGVVILMAVGVGCDKGPTPPPPIPDAGSVIHINVSVVRGATDDVEPDALVAGYFYKNSKISTLVNDFINRHQVLTGQKVSFVWDRQIHEITVMPRPHIWQAYGTWVEQFAYLGAPYYVDDQLNLIFVPGIVDGSQPTAFMDSFTIDPAHNQDVWWETHAWKPMVLISDCWVSSQVTEPVGEMPGDRKIPVNTQMKHLILHHAIGRYLLRHTCDTPDWDCQENRVNDTHTYMHRWNERAFVGVRQGEILNRIQSGRWQSPDLP